jgi:hypothetical protein
MTVFLSSREGQDDFYRSQFFDLHYLPGSKTAQEFKQTFKSIKPVVVTNDVLTTRWNDYESVAPTLAKLILGGK